VLPDVELRAGNLLSAPAAEVLAVGVSREDDELVVGSGGSLLLDRVGVDLFTLLDRADAKGSAGEVVALPVLDGSALQQVLLVGVGAGEPSDMRRAGAALARRARGRDLVATSIADQTDEAGLAAFVEGIVLGASRSPGGPPGERCSGRHCRTRGDGHAPRGGAPAGLGDGTRWLAVPCPGADPQQ
jgi:leucyl aminopeptidase